MSWRNWQIKNQQYCSQINKCFLLYCQRPRVSIITILIKFVCNFPAKKPKQKFKKTCLACGVRKIFNLYIFIFNIKQNIFPLYCTCISNSSVIQNLNSENAMLFFWINNRYSARRNLLFCSILCLVSLVIKWWDVRYIIHYKNMFSDLSFINRIALSITSIFSIRPKDKRDQINVITVNIVKSKDCRDERSNRSITLISQCNILSPYRYLFIFYITLL